MVLTAGVLEFGKNDGDNQASAPPTMFTLESGIDVGQGINVGPGKFVKKNKHRAFSHHRKKQ